MSDLAPARPLLAEARVIYAEVIEVESAIRGDYDRLLSAGWRLGQKLCALKDAIGHGKWLFWLGANWSELGERKAQYCMTFFRDNADLPNPKNSSDLKIADFDVDSIRRFLGGYMPAKVRPQLEGDERLAPVASFDAVTNKFALLQRRISEGHATPPPLDAVGSQIRLIIDGLRTIYGRETIDTLLA